MSKAVGDSGLLGKLALFYMLMVVYGSLVPLDWNGLALDTAWQRFKQIPYLNLGVGSRADWVANIVLYVPLGFLLCGWLVGESRRGLAKSLAMAVSFGVCAGYAVGVEFAQEFFPPRTVSLNDLYAEMIGSTIGIAAWVLAGVRLQRLVQGVFSGGPTVRNAVLVSYALVYLALSAFPYDLLLSAEEWRGHLASGRVGWFFADDCGGHCIIKLLPETLAVAPLGVLVVLMFRAGRRLSVVSAAIGGLMLGAAIEGVQLAIDSGVSQGASVLTRALGVGLGTWFAGVWPRLDIVRYRHLIRPAILLSVGPYLIALTWLSRGFSGGWLSIGSAWDRLPGIHFLPFYYHYYTSEAVALVSLLYQFGLYLPIGAAVWAWRWVDRTHRRDLALAVPVAVGVTLSVFIEVGKLFLSAEHPDPSNVLIAIAAVLGGYYLLSLVSAGDRSGPELSVSLAGQDGAAEQSLSAARKQQTPAWAWVLAVPLFCAAAIVEMTNPLGALAGIALVAYAILLWWRPNLWMVCVLAFLPLLDLTPWSGRLFWTDFDTLLLVTLAVGYLRLPLFAGPAAILPAAAKVLLTLFGIAALIGLVNGLLPLAPIDLNSFSHYTSPYNALRAVKPLVFALAFLPLLLLEWGDRGGAAHRLAIGATLGVLGELIVVLWERVTFPGLFNFETDYRITGSFPGMHVGGAQIEAYLATALPFVALWAWQRRRIWVTVVAAGLYGLGAYAVMVTFARGGQAAFVFATLIILLGFGRLALRDNRKRFVGIGAAIMIAGIAALVSWPVLSGKFSQSRLATIGQDTVTRTSHWADALDIFRSHDSPIFGVGLGTFPAAYFWGSREISRPSTYAFSTQGDNTYLRLGSGETLYFEQQVAVKPERQYTLAMDLRSDSPGAALTAPVCEKALLYSFVCAWTTLSLSGEGGQWAHYEIQLSSKGFGPPGSPFQRPVKLSLFNGKFGTVVDVDNVVLREVASTNLVLNGDFSSGMQQWFFSTDSHLPWHAKNLFLHVLFEQGWFGFACFIAIFAYAMVRWARGAWRNDSVSLVFFAAFTAFLVVGVVDSLVDETRLAFLCYLLLMVGCATGEGRACTRSDLPATALGESRVPTNGRLDR